MNAHLHQSDPIVSYVFHVWNYCEQTYFPKQPIVVVPIRLLWIKRPRYIRVRQWSPFSLSYLKSSHITWIAGIFQTILITFEKKFEKKPRKIPHEKSRITKANSILSRQTLSFAIKKATSRHFSSHRSLTSFFSPSMLTVQQQQDPKVFHFDYHMISCHNIDYTSLHELIKLGTFQGFYLDLHKRLATKKYFQRENFLKDR